MISVILNIWVKSICLPTEGIYIYHPVFWPKCFFFIFSASSIAMNKQRPPEEDWWRKSTQQCNRSIEGICQIKERSPSQSYIGIYKKKQDDAVLQTETVRSCKGYCCKVDEESRRDVESTKWREQIQITSCETTRSCKRCCYKECRDNRNVYTTHIIFRNWQRRVSRRETDVRLGEAVRETSARKKKDWTRLSREQEATTQALVGRKKVYSCLQLSVMFWNRYVIPMNYLHLHLL